MVPGLEKVLPDSHFYAPTSEFNILGSWFHPLRHASICMKVGTCLQLSFIILLSVSRSLGVRQSSFLNYSSCPLHFNLNWQFLLIHSSQETCGFCMDLTGNHSIRKRLLHRSFWNNPFTTFGFCWNGWWTKKNLKMSREPLIWLRWSVSLWRAFCETEYFDLLIFLMC